MECWRRLADKSDEDLAKVSLAEHHLVCAVGLPWADDAMLRGCPATLEEWTDHIREGTARREPLFDAHPERFKNSRGYFRMLVLTTLLQRDYGVRAGGKLNDDHPDFSDSRDVFLHGPLNGHPGTCSSLPFLFGSIGLALGYPLALVQSPRHMSLRWDDGAGERFNVECTSTGFFTPDDDYYRTWPTRTEPGEEWGTYYFRPLTPRELLSGCLMQRAGCLYANGRHREAALAAAWSCETAPHHRYHLPTLYWFLEQWELHLAEALPRPFTGVTIGFPPPQFASLPLRVEQQIVHMRVLDDLSRVPEVRAAYRPPVRRSPLTGTPVGLPEEIVVNCQGINWRDDVDTHQPLRRL